MNQDRQFSWKDIPHCTTPKNLNINPNSKIINYNKSFSNNHNPQLFNPNINSSLKRSSSGSNILKDSEYTSDNSSDINFYSSSSSLKDQILSPGDDDLYLYVNQNQNKKNNINNPYYMKNKNNNSNSKKNNNDKNENIYNNNNQQNYNNDFDYNYYLNFDINNNQLKSIDDNNKKTLILDLDETLVHSSFHPLYFNNEPIQPDIFFTILFENKSHDVYVLKRPYIKEFMNKMYKLFNIYIFTASIKEYANPLLIKLDKHKMIAKKLFRESCTLSQDNKYIKDLNILNENLKNVILVDNNPNSYRYNKCNGVPIKTWHYDKADKELIKIIPFLTFLSMVDDVRKYIPKVVEGDQVNYHKVNSIINSFNFNGIMKNQNGDNDNKKLMNKIKKQKIQNNNINNYSGINVKIKYNPSYTNEDEGKVNRKENSNRKKCSLNSSKTKIEKYLDDDENNNFFDTKINFNKVEERKNNYNTVVSNKKYFHSPATINFREPLNHFNSGIFSEHKDSINNENNMILSSGNVNLYQTNNNINNNNISNNNNNNSNSNKYQRSKSSNNFNELSSTCQKFSSINFNLVNSQSNNRKVKYSIDPKHKLKNTINNKNSSNYIKTIYQSKNFTANFFSYNNLKSNRADFSKFENSLYLENNDPILATCGQNNNYNNMNTNLKDEYNKHNSFKQLNENKTQRNFNNYNIKFLNQNKQAKNQNQNLFRNKNGLYKKRINENEVSDNNLNEPNGNSKKKNITNNDDSSMYLDNKKYNNFRNKNIKKSKNNYSSYRNNYPPNYNGKNNNSLSKTNEIVNHNSSRTKINHFIKQDINNRNESLNNNINKKIRSSTLNGHHNAHNKIMMNPNYEENKNCVMKVTKNIKKKVYSSLKDNNNNNNNNNDNNGINYKYHNNNGQSKNSNTSINYNTSKQKNKNNIKQKPNLDNEINLLNTFMEDFNKKEQKEVSYFANYKNISREIREINTQRLPKMGTSKKNISSVINYNYNSEKFITQKNRSKKKERLKNKEKDKREAKNEIFNKQNDDYFDKENFYANVYQRKNKPYIISKETNNYIKKKMKNVNTDDYYYNDIKMGNNTNDSDSIKNIKYVTLKKDESAGLNMKLYQKIIENEKLMNGRGKNNYSSNKI